MSEEDKQELGITSMSAPTNAPTPDPTTTEAPRSERNIALVAGIAIGVLVVLAGAFYLYNRKKNAGTGSGGGGAKGLSHANFGDFHDHFQMSEYEQMMNLNGQQQPHTFSNASSTPNSNYNQFQSDMDAV